LPSDLNHLARELMPHDAAGLQHPPPDVRVGIFGHMQISAANAAGANPQDQIGQPRFRIGHILDHQGGTDGL